MNHLLLETHELCEDLRKTLAAIHKLNAKLSKLIPADEDTPKPKRPASAKGGTRFKFGDLWVEADPELFGKLVEGIKKNDE